MATASPTSTAGARAPSLTTCAPPSRQLHDLRHARMRLPAALLRRPGAQRRRPQPARRLHPRQASPAQPPAARLGRRQRPRGDVQSLRRRRGGGLRLRAQPVRRGHRRLRRGHRRRVRPDPAAARTPRGQARPVPAVPASANGRLRCRRRGMDPCDPLREKPARGVKPLYAPADVDCGCSCGKSDIARCGGGSTKTLVRLRRESASQCSCGRARSRAARRCSASHRRSAKASNSRSIAEPPPKAVDPDDAAATINLDSPLDRSASAVATTSWSRTHRRCPDRSTPARRGRPESAGTPGTSGPAATRSICCATSNTRLGYNCALLAQLSVLVIVMPNPAGMPAFIWAVVLMFLVLLDALFACLCSALLPPVPDAHRRDPRTPRDASRRHHPCRVLRVCNWTVERKFATTFPSLQYWLSALPYGTALRQALQALAAST